MKRIATILFCLMLVLGITACGSNVGAGSVESDATTETKESQQAASVNTEAVPTEITSEVPDETDEPQTNKDILVVYFSATGTTKDVAEKIASIEDADLYEIIPVEPYSDADLNYNDADSRTTHEQNDPDIRPEIGSEDISLESYKIIYLGYPIWHGQAPRIISTFVEKYSFENITVIPFCTSGSSGIGQSAVSLENQAGSGNWLAGERFGGNISEDDLKSWINEIK